MAQVTTQSVFTGAITAAGNTTTAQVQPAGNVGGPVWVSFGVGAVSGTNPSVSPVVQFSMDGTTWLAASADETLPAVTAVGVTVWRVAQSRGPYARVSWAAPTGTTPSFTAAVAIWS